MDIDDIKKLREITGAGVTDCKKACDEAGGRFNRALEILRSNAEKTVEKKSAREIKSGIVDSYIHGGGRVGVLLKIGCETDFVAKNQDFKNMAHDIAIHIAAMNPQSEEELFSQPFVKNPEISVKDFIRDAVGKIGENIKIEQFARFEI